MTLNSQFFSLLAGDPTTLLLYLFDVALAMFFVFVFVKREGKSSLTIITAGRFYPAKLLVYALGALLALTTLALVARVLSEAPKLT
jgi:hypothetical protein